MDLRFSLPGLCALLCTLGLSATTAEAKGPKFDVYEYVVESTSGSVELTTSAIQTEAESAGWKLLATRQAGSPEGCEYQAMVLSLVEPAFAQQLMMINADTAPFALVDRINIFEDEKGVHVSIVDPRSIHRTVLLDDPACTEPAAEHRESLRALITTALDTPGVERGYGQARSKGHIGRTMGVMAGGSFDGKIKDELEVRGPDWRTIAERLAKAMRGPESEWGIELAYRYELPEHKTVILGCSGARMESKSFSIVRAGADKSRKKLTCPGIAHAGAYPLEVVVVGTEEGARIRMVDAMFRMKMYFEDAGKMAFMKNMGMPGSIADALRKSIRSEFKQD